MKPPRYAVSLRIHIQGRKNIEAFLNLDLPGSKVVVDDEPRRLALMRRHPGDYFTGWHDNGSLARSQAVAGAFVFPSRMNTFGLVLIEALALGTPVAAYPVTGPLEVVTNPPVGVLDEDLRAVCLRALHCNCTAAIEHMRSAFPGSPARRSCARHWCASGPRPSWPPASEKLSARPLGYCATGPNPGRQEPTLTPL